MKTKKFFIIAIALAGSYQVRAQVQVSIEPRHKKVLENKYIRLLDVWLRPGDTTLFHIHSTPSVFVYFSSNTIATQIKDGDWVQEQTIAGKTWYRSFSPGELIHRVTNPDSLPFHVTDVEILSSFEPYKRLPPLPLTVLYENEKIIAYQVNDSSLSDVRMSHRGPMIAEVISGQLVYHVDAAKQEKAIKPGGYLYIEPGTSFYLNSNGKVNMVLFEIK